MRRSRERVSLACTRDTEWRAHGNENREFDAHGTMEKRYASINDQPIAESERKFRWERPA